MRAQREGIAMLNRTNRTLSANFNRLNLGTRSLTASVCAVNVNVAKNQRVALDHLRFHRGDSMRFGMLDPIVIPIMGQRWSVGVPSSPSVSERMLSKRSGFEVVAELPPVGDRTIPAAGESTGRPRPRSQARATTARACWRAWRAAARTSYASIHLAAARPAAGG